MHAMNRGLLVLAAASTLVTTMAAPSPAVAEPVYHEIVVEHSGKCLDVQDSGHAHGANVLQANCVNGPNQRWRLRMPEFD